MEKTIGILIAIAVTAGMLWFVFTPHPEKVQEDVLFTESAGGRSDIQSAFGIDSDLDPGFIVNGLYYDELASPAASDL